MHICCRNYGSGCEAVCLYLVRISMAKSNSRVLSVLPYHATRSSFVWSHKRWCVCTWSSDSRTWHHPEESKLEAMWCFTLHRLQKWFSLKLIIRSTIRLHRCVRENWIFITRSHMIIFWWKIRNYFYNISKLLLDFTKLLLRHIKVNSIKSKSNLHIL
jgi:hypothetical protein